ncbi:hypothetical protein C8J57DRAFT_1242397 [Mycena rebaudengoi]|nr:hypothetical protein C8J57DRAFT_1242397 [Mycena rebaudengoi]
MQLDPNSSCNSCQLGNTELQRVGQLESARINPRQHYYVKLVLGIAVFEAFRMPLQQLELAVFSWRNHWQPQTVRLRSLIYLTVACQTNFTLVHASDMTRREYTCLSLLDEMIGPEETVSLHGGVPNVPPTYIRILAELLTVPGFCPILMLGVHLRRHHRVSTCHWVSDVWSFKRLDAQVVCAVISAFIVQAQLITLAVQRLGTSFTPHSTHQLFSVFLWLPNLPGSAKFEMEWKESLEWEANIAEFVLFLHRETRAPAVPKGSTKISSERALRSGIPSEILTAVAERHEAQKGKNQNGNHISSPYQYYTPCLLRQPRNLSPLWFYRCEVGQLECYELTRGSRTALGRNGIRFQLCHKTCIPDAGSTTPMNGCFATTNQIFWKTGSIGKFRANATPGPFSTPSLEPLSSPIEEGYNDTFITDEMREVYMAFVERTRSEDSDEYLGNLSPGICLSADNTFKAGGKATVAYSSKARSKLVKSTLNFLNDGNEIVAWRFCQSASPAEMREVLEGFKKRCVELYIYFPLTQLGK